MKKILSLSLAVAIAFTFFPALAPPARAAAGDVMVNFSSTGSGTIAAAASTTGSLSSGDALDSDDAEIITFTATPHPGYRVKEWSGAAAGTSSASSTFTCTADTPGLISVYVEFEAIPPQPTVTSVLPTGAGVPVSGNVTITFNTAMNTSVSGAVTLNSTAGNVSLSSGTWTSSTVYSIPYSGLANNTTYTFSIDNGFRDPAGNTATYTGSNSFTTAAAATVTYKRNRNASDAVSSTDTVTSSPYTIKSDLQLSFDNPGYTFNNWFTAASGGTPYAAGGSYPITTDLTLYAQWTAASFVAVTDIKSVPTAATAGTPLTLTGTVEPSTATNKTIVWSVVNAGNTGATISGSTLTTTAAGTATIQATITNGATPTTSFTKTFNITVTGGIPKIDSVSLGSATDYTVGTAITTTLSGNTGGTPVYQWKRADSITGTGSNISGANSPSYTPTGADFGKYVYVEVTPRSTTNQTVQGVVVRASTRAQIGLRITARVTGGGGGSVTINGGAGSTGTVVYNRNNITLSVTKNTPADPVSWSANPAIGAFGTPTSTVTTSPVTTTYTPPAAPSGNIVITATLASANQTKINNARQRLGWYSSSSGYVNICGGNERNPYNGSSTPSYDYVVNVGDLNLPAAMASSGSGNNDITIAWTTAWTNPSYTINGMKPGSDVSGSGTSIIETTGSNRGRVTFPTSDAYLTLTATLTVTAATTAENNALTNKQVSFQILVRAGNDQAAVNAVAYWLTWDRIRGGNTSQNRTLTSDVNSTSHTYYNGSANDRYTVTANLALQPTIESLTRDRNNNNVSTTGVTLEWSVYEGGSSLVNTNTGIVAFPPSGSVNGALRATVRRNNATATVYFYLNVQPSTDQAVVNEAINWLTWNQIRKYNDTSSSSTGPYLTLADLTLPTSHTTTDNKTVNIRWETSNTTCVTAAGVVRPPSSGSQEVTVTAVFTYGAITSTTSTNNPNIKKFNLTVRMPTDAESVRIAKEALTWDAIKNRNISQNAVSSNLTLSTVGEAGTVVTWASSNPSVVSTAGAVTIPLSGSSAVTLTATIRKNNSSDTKSISLYVGQPVIDVTTTPNGGAEGRIWGDDFGRLSENGTKAVEVRLGNICTVTFDAAAASEIGRSAGTGDIIFTAEKVSYASLPFVQQSAVGSRPVYEISVRAANRYVTTFSGGRASVTIPYVLGLEDANSVLVYHLTDTGKLEELKLDCYESGSVFFSTNHFSKFVIGYNQVTYTDAAAVAATGGMSQHIAFTGARKLFSGDQFGNFMPNSNMKRSEFVAMLRNFDGADLTQYTSTRFPDAQNNWWTGPISWAERNGILGDYADVYFYPDDPISRADMAYMLYNFMNYKGITLAKVRDLSFTDIGHLPVAKRNAIQTLAEGGVISGLGNGIYGPDSGSTRAMVASIMAMFIKTVSKQRP